MADSDLQRENEWLRAQLKAARDEVESLNKRLGDALMVVGAVASAEPEETISEVKVTLSSGRHYLGNGARSLLPGKGAD